MASTLTHSIFSSPTLANEHERGVTNEMKNKYTDSESKHDMDGNLSVKATAGLLERLIKKDADALAELYDAYAGLLMSVIMSVLKNKAESEDVLQDSFIVIYNKAEMYSPQLGKPTSWMATIARNKAYDRYRKLVRQSDGMENVKQELATRSYSSNKPPEEANEELLVGVNALSKDQREAIELVFYEGLTQSEVAEKLQAPLGTVKARIRRGLLKLKKSIIKE